MDTKTITQMISMWPSRRALADDIGAPLATVHKWAQSNSIPPRWQAAFVSAAKLRGYPVTADDVDAAHVNRGAA